MYESEVRADQGVAEYRWTGLSIGYSLQIDMHHILQIDSLASDTACSDRLTPRGSYPRHERSLPPTRLRRVQHPRFPPSALDCVNSALALDYDG